MLFLFTEEIVTQEYLGAQEISRGTQELWRVQFFWGKQFKIGVRGARVFLRKFEGTSRKFSRFHSTSLNLVSLWTRKMQ